MGLDRGGDLWHFRGTLSGGDTNSNRENPFQHVQLGKSAPSNVIKTLSARFLETIVIELLCPAAADEDVPECLERWSKMIKFMTVMVKQILLNQLFIQSVVGFMKQHVDPIIDDYFSAQLYARIGK